MFVHTVHAVYYIHSKCLSTCYFDLAQPRQHYYYNYYLHHYNLICCHRHSTTSCPVVRVLLQLHSEPTKFEGPIVQEMESTSCV